MKNVLLGIGVDLLSDLDEHCKKYHYERSEFMRSLIRERIYFSNNSKSATPPIMKKAQEAERQATTIRKKTEKILNSPIGNMYGLCSKHNVFYASCGCSPSA